MKKRVMTIEETAKRGTEISIRKELGEYYAVSGSNSDKKYKVSLNPPSCECAWWQNNWGNKEIYVQKARASPCKHICALAGYLGKDVFEIFNKQINRVD
jgi:SWIM zinc finger.